MATLPPERIISITVDPRKFWAYVLVPGHPSGKDQIFLGFLGYRPRSQEDATILAKTYHQQASTRFKSGDVLWSRADSHGQRVVIDIEVKGHWVRSVWILRPEGELALVTPFSGFSEPRAKGD